MAYQFDQASSSTATSSGYHNLPAPCTVPVQAFLVNPSPHELAVGSVEQYRPSKLSKAWKNVVLSLVKSEQDTTSLCVWRDTIQQDGSSQLQLIQHFPASSLQYANKMDASYHDGSSEPGCRFSVMTTTMDELHFRCQGEPQACQSWVTTLQTVCDHVQQTSNYNYTPVKKKETPPPADLLSFDEAPMSTANQTPDLLAAQNWQLNQAPLRTPNPNIYAPQQQQQQQQQQQNPQFSNTNSQYMQPNNPGQQYGQQFNSNSKPNYQHQRHPQANHHHHPAHVRSLSPPPTHTMQQQRQFSNPPPLNPLRGAIPGMYGQAPINMATPSKTYPPTNMRSQTPPPRPPGSMPRATTVPLATPQHPANRSKPTQHHHPPHRSHSMPFPKDAANANTNNSHSQERIKQYVISNWAVYPPPALPQLKSLRELIRSVHTVLPPPNLVANHAHFSKWKPPPSTLLTLQDQTRLTRKLKVVLHPDKLPQDFTADQTYLCKVVWDVLNDAQQQQQQQH